MSVKENLVTLQLLPVCIFKSKGMDSTTEGIEIDTSKDSDNTLLSNNTLVFIEFFNNQFLISGVPFLNL